MRPLFLIAALVVTACKQAPETPAMTPLQLSQASASSQTAIDAINIRYARYLNENLPDSVAALFTENGVMMPAGMPAVTGRSGIREFVAANPSPPGATYTFMAMDVQVLGGSLVERGEYNLSVPAADKTPAMSINGKYLVHWRAEGGRWLQVTSIWNQDTPMAPMPAPAAPKR